MLTFLVTFRCFPGKREEFLDTLIKEGIVEACRAESGNSRYDYYLPVDSGDDLLLIEQWKDADAVSTHARQVHMHRMIELKSGYVTDIIMEKYET